MIEKKEKRKEKKEIMKLTSVAPRSIQSKVLKNAKEFTILNLDSEELNCKTLRDNHSFILNPPPYVYNKLELSASLCKTNTNKKFYKYKPQNFYNLNIYDDFILFNFSK